MADKSLAERIREAPPALRSRIRREIAKKQAREWYERNREYKKAYQRAQHVEHRERDNEYLREWRRKRKVAKS